MLVIVSIHIQTQKKPDLNETPHQKTHNTISDDTSIHVENIKH